MAMDEMLNSVAILAKNMVYKLGKKHKWMHGVFHIACVIGSLLQILCILLYVI